MVINTVTQLAVYSLVVGFIMTFVVITGFAYTTLLERKLLARLQHRVGMLARCEAIGTSVDRARLRWRARGLLGGG